MPEIFADFTKPVKEIRPLNGFNNAARQTDYGPVLPAFIALQPPVIRLHDTAYPYGGGHYVDVNNIFRDFGADENDPAAYDFTLTDRYIEPLVENGAQIMYRLGCSIEHAPKKYNVFPPADLNKWARVCGHIVQHFNCGWANGHEWNIKYWEIWNEPDGLDKHIEPYGPPNWQGTAEQYYELYRITANHLKACCPEINVGGYSSCYILGKFENGRWQEGDTSFFTGFLKYISAPQTKAPLDFFTWHGYLGNQGIKKIDREFGFVNDTLNAFGFHKTKRIDAEWNCCVCDTDTTDFRTQYYLNMRNEKGAAHMAAALYEMQRCGVDAAMFYDAQLWKEYGPLFEVPGLRPTPAYDVFAGFSRLYALGTEYESTQAENVYALAAGNGEAFTLALANVGAEAREVLLHLRGAKESPGACGGALPCRFTKTGDGLLAALTLPGFRRAHLGI